MIPTAIKVYVMTSSNKRVPILTKEHFCFIHAEISETAVSFAQINYWIDTKLETVWNSLIVYNILCACSVVREGARCIPDQWENSNSDDMKLTGAKHQDNCDVSPLNSHERHSRPYARYLTSFCSTLLKSATTELALQTSAIAF